MKKFFDGLLECFGYSVLAFIFILVILFVTVKITSKAERLGRNGLIQELCTKNPKYDFCEVDKNEIRYKLKE